MTRASDIKTLSDAACDPLYRYGNDSFLSTLDIKSQFIRRSLYKNLLRQGREVTAMIALGDLDADGKAW
jgi:hypothetical protein